MARQRRRAAAANAPHSVVSFVSAFAAVLFACILLVFLAAVPTVFASSEASAAADASAAAAGDSGSASSSTSLLMELDHENFESSMKPYHAVLVMFKSKMCGHCQRALPDFKRAAETLASTGGGGGGVALGIVECPISAVLCQSHGVTGYPTYRLYHTSSKSKAKPDSAAAAAGGGGGLVGVPLEGFSRSHDAIVDLMSRYQGDTLQPLTASEAQAIATAAEAAAEAETSSSSADKQNQLQKLHLGVLYVPDNLSKRDEIIASVSAAADDIRMHYNVRLTTDPTKLNLDSTMKQPQQPVLRVYRSGDQPADYSQSLSGGKKKSSSGSHGDTISAMLLDTDAVRDFFKHETLPLVGEITPETYHQYTTDSRPLLFFFYETEAQRTLGLPVLRDLAATLRSSLCFGFLNATQFGNFGVSQGMSGTWPAVMVRRHYPESRWILELGKNSNKDNIKKTLTNFANGVVKGTEPPFLMSESIPESNDGPVVVVVGKQFDKIVTKSMDQDVLVFYHAEWCGYCKQFAPTFDTIGKYLKEATGKAIVAAKMEATKNDVPPSANVTIEGFPTIVLYPATATDASAAAATAASGKGKKTPIVYSGNRSYEDIVKFLEANAFHRGKLLERPKPATDDDLLLSKDEL